MNKESNPISVESWAVSYRPKSLDDIVGQEEAVEQIRGMFKTKRIPQCLLITGATGSGKTSLCRLIANTINGIKDGELNPDFNEFNMGDTRGIDFVREIVKQIKYKPYNNFRIILLDEVHQILAASASVLLKPLEETPKHAIWLLATDKPEKLLPTIIGRCTQINLRNIQPNDLKPLLYRVYKKEKLNFGDDYKKTLRKVAEISNGQPRSALQLLQKISHIVSGSNNKNVNEALKVSIKQQFDQGVENVAIKSLLGIYLNNSTVLNKSLLDIGENYNGYIYQLLEINKALLDKKFNVREWYPYAANRLFSIMKEKDIKPSINRIIKVHDTLVDMRNTLSIYGVSEIHLITARLNKLIESK